MIGCLDDNEASEFASGTLPGDASIRVESHLATCRDCRSLVAALAPSPDEDIADSDIITSPRKAALGKKGKRIEIAVAPTERPLPAGSQPDKSTEPGRRRRQDPVVIAGDTIGRYIILARLGAGGMGVVYTAYDPQLDRKIALKLLRTGTGLADTEGRSRLVREAQAIAQLSHPNVVAVFDVGTADTGEVYVAMELVEGETLTSWLGHWDRSWREILELFFQAGRGLAAAHARGLMHRDFKPDNVLVGADGRVRVTDFGLARTVIDQVEELVRDRPRPDLEALRATLTATGTVLGTPRYMAPEQLRGADADARSDQFSFCVALYEALYERHPLPGDSVIDMVQHGAEPEPPPEDTKVPVVIGKAIMRGMSPEPNKRFPTLAALLVELTPPVVHARRRTWVAAVGAVALVAGGAAAAMIMRSDAKQADQTISDQNARIQQLEDERRDLIKRIDDLMYADGGLQEKIAIVNALRDEVRKKDEQIAALIDRPMPPIDAAPKIAIRKPPPDAGPPPAPKGIDNATLAKVVLAKRPAVDSCMQEWMERKPEDLAATIIITFTVNPDGSLRKTSASGIDDGVIGTCVANAVGRADFPTSKAITAGEATIVVANGEVSMTARAVETRPPAEIIDLGGSPGNPGGYPGASGQ